ncbi:peptidoglycan-binding domain-containing protein [Amycolatopsis sp. NPDC005003]
MALQKTAGNAAVAQLMRAGRPRVAVQRCGSIPPERCPCHESEEIETREHPAVQRIADDLAPVAEHPTARQGSRGLPVFELQVKLNLEGASPALSADSIFGPRTRHGVVNFQTGHGLEPDGIVGPKTWAAVDAGVPEVAQPPDCATLMAALGQVGRDGAPVAQTAADTQGQAGCGLIPPALLAQVLAILGQLKPKPSPVPPATGKCTSKTAPGKVIASHTASATKISAAGDKILFTVHFTCLPAISSARTIFTVLETAAGTDLGLRKAITMKGSVLTREWDGKKLFNKVGTFVVADGKYRHRVEEVVFAFDSKGKSLKATGPEFISPTVTVDVRAQAGSGKHNTTANIDLLAEIIASEMGITTANDDEREAIGWAVRNQMLRLGTNKVADARDFFHDATGHSPSAAHKTMATTILSAKTMATDTTGGSIKWFSPQSMPPKASTCEKSDCTGGKHPVVNSFTGKKEEVFFPGFTKTMTHQPVAGTREWFVKLYAL